MSRVGHEKMVSRLRERRFAGRKWFRLLEGAAKHDMDGTPRSAKKYENIQGNIFKNA